MSFRVWQFSESRKRRKCIKNTWKTSHSMHFSCCLLFVRLNMHKLRFLLMVYSTWLEVGRTNDNDGNISRISTKKQTFWVNDMRNQEDRHGGWNDKIINLESWHIINYHNFIKVLGRAWRKRREKKIMRVYTKVFDKNFLLLFSTKIFNFQLFIVWINSSSTTELNCTI